MTHEQYQRWKDFALRMAKTCFTKHRRPSAAWIIDQVECWFHWRDYQKDWGDYTSWDQDGYPLCDHVREFFEGEFPRRPRCKACDHECRTGWPHFEQTCPLCDLECRCDEREERSYEQFDEQWLGPVRCCLRAGIDMACEPTAGVLGFTAGDLRRMFPEGVPAWVFPPDERLKYWLTDKVNGTFAELPDEAGVLL